MDVPHIDHGVSNRKVVATTYLDLLYRGVKKEHDVSKMHEPRKTNVRHCTRVNLTPDSSPDASISNAFPIVPRCLTALLDRMIRHHPCTPDSPYSVKLPTVTTCSVTSPAILSLQKQSAEDRQSDNGLRGRAEPSE